MWDTNKLSNTPIKTLPHPSFIYKDLILSYKSYDDDTDNWYIQNIYFSRVWDTKKLSNTPIKTLPHPSFIYTAKFHPRVPKILVTGGYDRIVRIWTAEGQDAHATVSLRPTCLFLIYILCGLHLFVSSACAVVNGKYDRIVRIWTAEGADAHATVSGLRLKYFLLVCFFLGYWQEVMTES